MKDTVDKLENKLLYIVTEGGNNFSSGQKQLLCFARALLKKPKILIFDEATSSVDNDTDNIIQDMIRLKFKNTTILTIAHRLNTISECDRIMVIDNGNLVEIDSAINLLQNKNGYYSKLWNKFQENSK